VVRAAMLMILSLVAAPSTAATEYFLDFDNVLGDATLRGHENTIAIASFVWGVSAAGSSGGSTSRPVFKDLQWSQLLDRSTPTLFSRISTVTQIKTAQLDAVSTGGRSNETYFSMLFDDVVLTALDISGSTGVPSVTGAFSYRKITLSFRPQKSDGSLDTPITASYDLETGIGSAAGVLAVFALANGSGPSAVPLPAALPLLVGALSVIGGLARRKVA
jgi:type VI secretion system secreted protein Hcp